MTIPSKVELLAQEFADLTAKIAANQKRPDLRAQVEAVSRLPATREALIGVVGPASAGKTTVVGQLTGVALPTGPRLSTSVPTFLLPGDAFDVRLVPRSAEDAEAGSSLLEVAQHGAHRRFERAEVTYVADSAFPRLAFIDFPALGGHGFGAVGDAFGFLTKCDVLLYCWPDLRRLEDEDRYVLSGAIAPRAGLVVALTGADLPSLDDFEAMMVEPRELGGPQLRAFSADHFVVGLDPTSGIAELAQTLRDVALRSSVIPSLGEAINTMIVLASASTHEEGGSRPEVGGRIDALVDDLLEDGLDWIDRCVDRVSTEIMSPSHKSDVEMGNGFTRALNRELGRLREWIEERMTHVERKIHRAMGATCTARLRQFRAMQFIAEAERIAVGGGATLKTLSSPALGASLFLDDLGLIPAMTTFLLIPDLYSGRKKSVDAARALASKVLESSVRSELRNRFRQGAERTRDALHGAAREPLVRAAVHVTATDRKKLRAMGQSLTTLFAASMIASHLKKELRAILQSPTALSPVAEDQSDEAES